MFLDLSSRSPKSEHQALWPCRPPTNAPRKGTNVRLSDRTMMVASARQRRCSYRVSALRSHCGRSWTPASPRAFNGRGNAVKNAPSSESPTSKPKAEDLTSAVGGHPGGDTTAWETTLRLTRAQQ